MLNMRYNLEAPDRVLNNSLWSPQSHNQRAYNAAKEGESGQLLGVAERAMAIANQPFAPIAVFVEYLLAHTESAGGSREKIENIEDVLKKIDKTYFYYLYNNMFFLFFISCN